MGDGAGKVHTLQHASGKLPREFVFVSAQTEIAQEAASLETAFACDQLGEPNVVDGRIPTVDFSPFLARSALSADAVSRLGSTFEEFGFVSLTGHGIDKGIVSDCFAAAEEFFARPEAEKTKVQNQRNHRGYVPLFDSTTKSHQRPSGLKAFSIGHFDPPTDPTLLSLPFYAPTPWPELANFRERIEPCYRAMYGLGEALLRAVALHRGADEAFFAKMSKQTYANMRLVHYPPQEKVAATSNFGVNTHVDRGLLTLLIQDQNGGLSVQAPGDTWIPVVPDPDAIVVNVGSLLREWTNGRYPAALHRVVNSSGRERYSMPLFVHPSFHMRIDPRSLVGQDPVEEEFQPFVAGEEVFAGFARDRPSWKQEATAA